jgi:benzoate membrane transport protein
MRFFKDVALSTVFAGGVTVLVGFTSSLALVFQAAQATGADAAQMASWVWALGMGMAATCIGLSWRYRTPIVTAWSTSGAAMLIISAPGWPMGEVVAAFVMSSVMVTLVGFSGWFERFMDRVPLPLAAGMLAGVLLRLGLDVFVVMSTQLWLPLIMVMVYLLTMRWSPRYAVVLTMLVGGVLAAMQGQVHLQDIDWQWAHPVWTTPSFTLSGFISLALPFFIVNMASQNIPGIAIMKTYDFEVPFKPVMVTTGLTSVFSAPIGGFAFNLAAITAAINANEHAHPNHKKRYLAAVYGGVIYLILAILAVPFVAVVLNVPHELILAMAGVALFATITSAISAASEDSELRLPAMITFLVGASGFAVWGIGAAFWALASGVVVWQVLRKRS